MKTWNDRLAATLKELGYKQTRLARELGVKSPSITEWLQGTTQKLSAEHAEKICSLLGIRLKWLLYGTLPRWANEGGSSEVQDGSASDGLISIPQINVSLSQGDGAAANSYTEIVNTVQVQKRWLADNFMVTAPANLRLVTGRGDSMSPTIADGDVVLIDTGVTELTMDAIFAFARGDDLFLKRIHRLLDGSIMVVSDNKAYDSYPLNLTDLDNVTVCGRAIFIWNGRKL
ncbi:MAG: S24 family peptidase [Gammaproteobacteria bacterium]|nr:S24 family peptidase [Gammaproteobacteria bacterium]